VLYRDAKIVILDEPTAVLAPQEAAPLYAMLRRMAEAGRAVCVVTHKLDEVHAFADEVTVMRRGAIVVHRVVDRARAREDVVSELSREVMGGEPPPTNALRSTAPPGDDVLVLEDVTLEPRLRGVSLSVRAGEVVGVCGVEGSGQDELAHVIAGLERAQGRVRTPGSSRPVALIHSDRHREGLVLEASLLDNALLGELGAHLRPGGFIDGRSTHGEAYERVRRAGVEPADLSAPVRALSGGNQQKVVVERACARADGISVRVLVASQPTRGVDVGAARAIHERIAAVARAGVGVLLMSSDLDELRALSSRLLVLARGKVVAEVPPDTAAARLGELMLGGGE
jgi:simple sugar transport system ATP-binding protein